MARPPRFLLFIFYLLSLSGWVGTFFIIPSYGTSLASSGYVSGSDIVPFLFTTVSSVAIIGGLSGTNSSGLGGAGTAYSYAFTDPGTGVEASKDSASGLYPTDA